MSKFCRIVLFLHGGSDKQPVFIAVGQTSDFFPLLSWQTIPSGRPILSYTVNMKMRQKWRKVCCLTCLMNKLTLLHTHDLITTCLNFLAFYQNSSWMWRMSLPPPPPHKDAQEVCVWCRVLELISPLDGMLNIIPLILCSLQSCISKLDSLILKTSNMLI